MPVRFYKKEEGFFPFMGGLASSIFQIENVTNDRRNRTPFVQRLENYSNYLRQTLYECLREKKDSLCLDHLYKYNTKLEGNQLGT